MKVILRITILVLGTGIGFLSTLPTYGQVVINELVEDEQDFETTDISPDTREFVELYNAGATPVDVSGWTLGTVNLGSGLPGVADAMPAGSMIPAGGYFVIGAPGVANVNFSPVSTDIWPNLNEIFELRNASGTLIDALAVDTFRGVELANATQEQLDQIAAGETVGPAAKGGWWGQLESNNDGPDGSYPNLPMSLGRYRDGRDNNVNGRDFGMLPATPGTSNNLMEVPVHEVTDVDAVALGTVLRDDYYASFKLPRVINPGAVDLYNPNVIPASPQGGRAIIAWDETGGGNAVFSDEYTNKFELYAFIDPRPFNVTTANSTQSEASVYGIGTTDPLFGTPNSADLLTGQPGTGGNITSSANGSTGLGWLIQRRTSNTDGTQSSAAVLQLIDFNDGGDGVLADAPDWDVIETIDLTGMNAGWHRLSLEYDEQSGEVTAFYDDEEFNFTTFTGLVGNFYIGYRENMPGASGSGAARPPTYDLFVPVVEPVLAGDYNDDGVVNAADYTVWRDQFGAASALPNETVTPGMVTQEDYDAWKANFGAVGGGGAALGAGAVPEPGSVMLGLVGVLLAVARMRRRD